jgi:hypothetical protein
MSPCVRGSSKLMVLQAKAVPPEKANQKRPRRTRRRATKNTKKKLHKIASGNVMAIVQITPVRRAQAQVLRWKCAFEFGSAPLRGSSFVFSMSSWFVF